MKRKCLPVQNSDTPLNYHKYKLIMYGNTICIKGNYNITSYSENLVMLKCNNDILSITGTDVVVSSIDADQIYISGKISDISIS